MYIANGDIHAVVYSSVSFLVFVFVAARVEPLPYEETRNGRAQRPSPTERDDVGIGPYEETRNRRAQGPSPTKRRHPSETKIS